MEQPLTIEGPGGASLAGILRTPLVSAMPTDAPAGVRRVVLILHGVLGHKNYCFLPQLAQQLDSLQLASYRFDFRGNGDSDGQLNYSRFDDDVDDIRTVHDALEKMGFHVTGIIGHSRGAWSMLKYVATQRPVSFAVNVASRYLMAEGPKKHSPEDLAHLASHGFFMWHYKRKGRQMALKVTQADMDTFANADVSHVRRIPPSVAVLTCHGLADVTIPPENAAYFTNLIPNHTLRLIPGADHFFVAKAASDLIKTIIQWLETLSVESQNRHFDRTYRNILLARVLPLEGVGNCRDVGGYPTLDCCIVRPRKFFRSGELSMATAKDLGILASLQIHTLLDLRSDPEINQRGVPDLQHVAGIMKRVHCPVFAEDYSPESLAIRWLQYTQGPEGFARAYIQILENGGGAFKEVFETLANNTSGAILVHCTAGKDRTGIVVMLFLMLMNVEDALICWDYEQTEQFLKRDPVQVQRIVAMTNNKVDEQGAIRMISASFDSMAATIRAFRARWSTVQLYLDQIGVKEATQKLLLEKYHMPASQL